MSDALTTDQVSDAKWSEVTGAPLASDGTMPFSRYVIRSKGKLDVGNLAGGGCHTRGLPKGKMIKGAQGNFPYAQDEARDGLLQSAVAEGCLVSRTVRA